MRLFGEAFCNDGRVERYEKVVTKWREGHATPSKEKRAVE
jgi:uncharacterized membrane protein YbaN (DUF454 family)